MSYDFGMKCPYPNCLMCLQKLPEGKREVEIKKSLASLNTLHSELQDSWTFALHKSLQNREGPEGELLPPDPKVCEYWSRLGIFNALVKLLSTKGCSEYAQYNALMALKGISEDPKSRMFFLKSSNCYPFFLRQLNCPWTMFRKIPGEILFHIFTRTATKDCKHLLTPEMLSTAMHTLTISEQSIVDNFSSDGDGYFQRDYISDRDNDPDTFRISRVPGFRETGVHVIHSGLLHFTDNPDELLKVFQGFKPSGRKYFFEKIINFSNPTFDKVANSNQHYAMIENMQKICYQPDLLIVLLDTSFTEIESGESRKELKELTLENVSEFWKYLDFTVKKIKLIIERRKFAFFEQVFKFWTSLNHSDSKQYTDDNFIEGFSTKPFISLYVEKTEITYAHYLWCIYSLKLFLLRMNRYYRTSKCMNEDEVNELHQMIENCCYRTQKFYSCAAHDYGRFTIHHRVCLLLIEEDTLRTKRSGEVQKNWDSIKSKVNYYATKGWYLVEDNTPLTAVKRKEFISKYLSEAEKYCKDKESNLFQKIEKLRENVSEYKCNVCLKAPTNEKSLLRCSRCKVVRYCGRDCQVADWPQHKKECGK